MNKRFLILLFSLILNALYAFSQDSIKTDLSFLKYSNPVQFEIGGITVSGVKYLDKNILVQLAGLNLGEKIQIPGDKITKAIEKLWNHGLFSDVKISATKVIGNKIFLNIYLQERPRLNTLSFSGVKTSYADELKEKMKLIRGAQVTDNVINNITNIIKKYFNEKGFLSAKVKIIVKEDSIFANTVNVKIFVDKGGKIKINDILIENNTVLSDAKIRRTMKETKKKRWYGLFKPSKFVEANYEEDKLKIIKKYNELGYRDARIISDTIYNFDDKTINVKIDIEEGRKYFIRNISWVGNTKYTSEQLSKILKVKRGDIFDQSILDKRLSSDDDAVGNLYLDDGYLFYNCTPIENLAGNDSIDLEMRIFEGKQARINRVLIHGNSKTNDHVVMRELRTRPGELFKKSDIIRSVRELAQLGHFDPEKISPVPIPNPAEGTVDLDYTLEERANDQVEISGGWGQNMIIGTIGLRFSNFSARNIFNKEAWRPLPTGDGQTLSIRAQATGPRYQSYSITFVEPWLGGKRPNSLEISMYHSSRSNGYTLDDPRRGTFNINGVSVGFGRRLSWPDDYFRLDHELNLQKYKLDKWPKGYFIFTDGNSNSVALKTVFSRNSIDNPLYTRRGSTFSLSLGITPPFSLFNKHTAEEYKNMDNNQKYKWIEYHKWNFTADWYTPLYKDLVLRTKLQFGYLGHFNNDLGPSPFEGFYVGGDGMTGYSMYGSETIGLRGYKNMSLTPDNPLNVFNKYTIEVRYPFSLSQSATIFGLVFLEGGNAWEKIQDFGPYSIKRSAGAGVRIFLPMLGLIGIDWGYGFDPVFGTYRDSGSQFHFVLGQQF